MQSTSPDAIAFATTSDTQSLPNITSVMATSIQAALVARANATLQAVTSQQQRDVLFPTPVQGNRVYRTDLGWEEWYYAQYDPTLNTTGAKTAGWYPGNSSGPTLWAQASSGATINTTASRFGTWTAQTAQGMSIGSSNGNVVATYEGLYQVTFSAGLNSITSGATINGYVSNTVTNTGNTYASWSSLDVGVRGSGCGIVQMLAGDGVSPFLNVTTGTGTVRSTDTFFTVRWVGVRQT